MNRIWSEHIQGPMTLYLSRKLRFDDVFFPQYDRLFGLDHGKTLRILEIGCGPGALAGALHRWYPRAEIAAVDRDSGFIEFARKHVPGIGFYEGDAASLPFADASFDVTISHTVCEHMEPGVFYAEQKRVLREGGICLVLSARRGARQVAECLRMTGEERAFWDRVAAVDDMREAYGVGQYAMTEQELPEAMEAGGFSAVTTGYAVADLTPDDPKYPAQMAEAMINAERYADLEAVQSTHDGGAGRILEIVNAKYDVRIGLYQSGRKQWDTNTSVTMIVRGVKRG